MNHSYDNSIQKSLYALIVTPNSRIPSWQKGEYDRPMGLEFTTPNPNPDPPNPGPSPLPDPSPPFPDPNPPQPPGRPPQPIPPVPQA